MHTCFSFGDNYYKKKEWVTMKPAKANIFVGLIERQFFG